MPHRSISKNIWMLRETLNIFSRGYYEKAGRTVRLKLSPERQRAALYYDAETVAALRAHPWKGTPLLEGDRCHLSVEEMDSFQAALTIGQPPVPDFWLEQSKDDADAAGSDPAAARPAVRDTWGDESKVLVLNFANALSPGGGARRGANAQEEDLCRSSSLLLSLESDAAAPYYQCHRALGSLLATDAMLLSPEVEIIRDSSGRLLEETAIVSVLTCAAPDLEGCALKQEELEKLYFDRIMGMLQVAAAAHYTRLVLGAWGCGVFENDPKLVSEAFVRAFSSFRFGPRQALGADSAFRRAVFAIPHSTGRNYQAFSATLSGLGGDKAGDAPAPARANDIFLDRIRGSLIGGAAGDALGYPVEFMSWGAIRRKHGEGGIREYVPDPASGMALISDDTQMTMFTACGLLYGETHGAFREGGGPLSDHVYHAYLDWLTTQTGAAAEHPAVSWILERPELHALRAPGGTCLSALESGLKGSMEKPINHSKGCGGVMRASPLALIRPDRRSSGLDELCMEGARLAAITHDHPMGYIPAAFLTLLIHLAAFPADSTVTLRDAIGTALERTGALFGQDSHFPAFSDLIQNALQWTENGRSDWENIHALGGGWAGDDAVAIAVYCAAKYEDDFTGGLIAAVNHSGDSDSTGAITGNILGAWLGYGKIAPQWKRDLELADVVMELADDLFRGSRMEPFIGLRNEAWERKYG